MPPAPGAPVTPIEWWWWALTATAMAIGLGVVLWALFWDRARGRRRCPKCWYDLAGQKAQRHEGIEGKAQRHEGTKAQSVDSWRCPECGKLITREKRMRKTRRNWRWALAALILLVIAPPSVLMIQVSRLGFWQAVPTWALIRIVDWQGWPEPKGVTPPRQLARPGQRARAMSPEGELYNRLSSSSLSRSDTEWVFGHAFHDLIVSRERWPIRVPIQVRTTAPFWATFVSRGRLVIRSTSEDESLLRMDFIPLDPRWKGPSVRELSPAQDLRSYIEFDAVLAVDNHASNGRLAAATMRHRFQYPLEIVESIHDILTPIDDVGLSLYLRRSLRFQLRRSQNKDPGIILTIAPDDSAIDTTTPPSAVNRAEVSKLTDPRERLGHVALGLQLQLRYHLDIIAEAFGSPTTNELRRGYSFIFYGDLRALNYSDFSDPAWTLHVIGDGEMALRDFDKDKYWAGEFSIPMSQVEVARTRR